MQFNDSTNGQGIVQDIDFLCDTDDVSYPIEDKTRNVNRWYYKVLSDILSVDARYQFDDSNHTDLPYFIADLVDGQKDYKLPDEHMRIRAVEVKGTDGDYRRLDQTDINDHEHSITNYRDNTGFPDEYDLIGETIRLYPTPDQDSVTLDDGIKIYTTRHVSVFETDDTSKEPGFDETFHRILSLGAAVDWLSTYGTSENAQEKQQWLIQLRSELKEEYARRNPEAGTRIRTSHKNTRQYI